MAVLDVSAKVIDRATAARFGLSVSQFHAANVERLSRFPLGLLATHTHDAKRSGDVRARVAALAGLGDEWVAVVREWFSVNAPLRAGGAPDPIEEYLVYQNLVGAWPIEAERLEGFVEKALREAKRNSNWASPDEGYEGRVKAFCRGLYSHAPFRESFDAFAARVATAGERVSLGQVLLKLTAPGLPDIYQGDEIVSLALVDPDNRRPVDWERRRELLDTLRGGGSLPDDADTRKLRLTVAALDLRRRRADAFAGAYEPIDAGEDAVAYVRGGEVLVVVDLRGSGAVIELPPGSWRDVVNGGGERVAGRIAVSDLVGPL